MKKICPLLILIVGIFCAFFFQKYETNILNWIQTLGCLAPLFFLILYCLATLLFLPTMILTFAGGALFGPILGTLFNLIGAISGAICAFFISRYLAFDWVSAKKSARIHELMMGIERRGWQFAALLRLVPIIPFNLVNYGLGVTRIKFRHYFLTTAIFLIPAEITFTYCGYASMNLLTHQNTVVLAHHPKFGS